MPRELVTPDALDLESPGRRDYWVELEHDSLWGSHLIPLTVLVGARAVPGKGVVAFGSNHGNEYEGPMALKHLLQEIRTEDVRGRIILVPVLNPAAFRTGTRNSDGDDRVNLNRAFVDGAGRTSALAGITHRIAAFVRERIWPHVHVVLDLHAGGNVCRFALGTSFHPVEDPKLSNEIEETARAFGTPLVVIYQNRTPGLLPSEGERLGKITVGGEFGWGEAVNPFGVRCARHGVLAACIRHAQLEGRVEKFAHHADGTQRKAEMVERSCFVSALWPGHYEPVVDCGERVRKGQTVAWLHDFNRIDEEALPIQAPHDGIVIAQAWKAVVLQGQQVLVVGKVLD